MPHNFINTNSDLVDAINRREDLQYYMMLYQKEHLNTTIRPNLWGGQLELLPPVLENADIWNWTYVAFNRLANGFSWMEYSLGLHHALPMEQQKENEPIFRDDENILADFTASHGLEVYTPPMILWFNVGNHPDSRPYNSVIFKGLYDEIRVLGSKMRPWVVFDYWPVRQEVKDFLFNCEKPTEGIFAIETKTDGTITCHIINRDGTIEPEFTVIDKTLLEKHPQFPDQNRMGLLVPELPDSQRQLQRWAGRRLTKIKFR